MSTYTPSITVEQAREIIKAAPRNKAIDAAMRFANCQDADVDGDGDVWIANPCTGHWLDAEKLCFLAESIEAGV